MVKRSLTELGTILASRNNGLSNFDQLDHNSFTTYGTIRICVNYCRNLSTFVNLDVRQGSVLGTTPKVPSWCKGKVLSKDWCPISIINPCFNPPAILIALALCTRRLTQSLFGSPVLAVLHVLSALCQVEKYRFRGMGKKRAAESLARKCERAEGRKIIESQSHV